MPTGHIKGDVRRRAVAAKAAHDRSAASLEGPLEDQLRRFFADQRTSTLARFVGKRGKQMLKRAGVRAAQPPSQGGAPGPGSPPPVGPNGTVTPAAAASAAGTTGLGLAGISAVSLAAGTVSAASLAAALHMSQTKVAARLGFTGPAELADRLARGLVTYELLKAAFAPTPAVGAQAAPSGAPAGPVDPSAIFDQNYWNDRLSAILRPYYDSAGTQAAANVRSHLELPPDFDDRGSLGTVHQLLEARGNQTSPQINAATYTEIVRQLQAGVAAGEGQQALAERINGVFETADKVRARRIAQTEVQAALNGSANAYAESLPQGTVGSKRWLAHWPPTGGSDPRTRDAHRLAAGQTVPLGSPFYVGGFPMDYPGDPAAPPELTVNCRCNPGWTNVVATDIRAAYRRWFDGDLVEVTLASGEKLTGTPNHPVLSTVGWVPLRQLSEGQHLICGSGAERVGVSHPDIDHPPTPFGELFDSLALSALGTYRVRGTPMDFHGDATDGKIDVVVLDHNLARWMDSLGLKQCKHFELTPAHAQVSSAGYPAALAWVGEPEAVRLPSAPWSDASCQQAGPNDVAVHPVDLSQRLLRRTSDVSFHDLRVGQPEARSTGRTDALRTVGTEQSSSLEFAAEPFRPDMSDPAGFAKGGSLHIEVDRVVKVTRMPFAGHVYSLSTGTERFIAEGIVTHNCALMFLPPGDDGGAIAFAAKTIHKAAAAAGGVTLSPAAAEFVDS